MIIKEFIETAIEGGWDSKQVWWRQDTGEIVLNLFGRTDLALMLLDPEAWKAVGKVKKWTHLQVPDIESKEYEIAEEWQYRMYMMISSLISGKTLEEYIATL